MEKQLKAIVGLGASTQENQSSYKLYSNISPATNCIIMIPNITRYTFTLEQYE